MIYFIIALLISHLFSLFIIWVVFKEVSVEIFIQKEFNKALLEFFKEMPTKKE